MKTTAKKDKTNDGFPQSLVEKYTLDLVVLFGSRARGDARESSDIDVAYRSKRRLTLSQEVDFAHELAPYFKNDSIDIVDIRKANPLLLYAVVRDGKVLYERSKFLFANLYAYAFKYFIEAKRLYQMQYDRLNEKKYGI